MKFLRQNVVESNCVDCRMPCDDFKGDSTVILHDTTPPVKITGELKTGRVVIGTCYDTGRVVLHDMGLVPEFTEPGQLGLHDQRIGIGQDEIEVNLDALWGAPEAPQEMTKVVRHWHGDTLN